MIVTDKFKNYSIWTQIEHENEIAKELEAMSEEERNVLFMALAESDLEHEITGMQLERQIVPIYDWIEDPFFMGDLSSSIYKPWKQDLIELFSSNIYSTAVISGGIGCLHQSTLLSTDKGKIAIGDISSPQNYLSYKQGQGRFDYMQGTQAFPKGKGMLYIIEHDDGSFIASANHLMLCGDGIYRSVEQMMVCPQIPIMSSRRDDDSFENDVAYVQLVKRRLAGYLDDCCVDSRLCDALLLLLEEVYQASPPLPADDFLYNISQSSVHHAKQDSYCLLAALDSCYSNRADEEIFQRMNAFYQRLLQSPESKNLLRGIAKGFSLLAHHQTKQNEHFSFQRIRQCLDVVDSAVEQFGQQSRANNQQSQQSLCRILSHQTILLFCGLFQNSNAASGASNRAYRHSSISSLGCNQVSRPSLRSYGRRAKSLLSYQLARALNFARSVSSYNPQLKPLSYIRSIEKVKTDWYWDLQVPGTNNYVAAGAVHHNSGKSTFSHLAILRMLYEASCLRNPAIAYGLAPGSSIAFCNLAKSKETARRVVFEAIVAKIMDIPYFKYEFPPIKDNKDEILFPKGLQILAGSSTDSSIIGANIFGGIIDEGNFWQQAKGKAESAKKEDSKFSKRWGNATKAGRLFDAVQRRMKSRYMRHGRLPGVLIVVSSKTTHDSFTETLIKNAKRNNDNTMFVRDRNLIEVKRDVFDSKTFRIVVGNESFQSKILGDDEEDASYKGATIIQIPEDLRADFEGNIDEALRDIAGVSTMAISQFIRKTNMIEAMKDTTRAHPFTCVLMGDSMQWDSRLPYRINWDSIARRLPSGEWLPKVNPEAKRHVHLDPGLTGDAFGVCIGHVAGTVPVKRLDGSTPHEIVEELPYFYIDFILSIQGVPGDEVLFRNVRQLCYEFSSHGFHLAEWTTDTYQSREMIQSLREQGYKAGMYSVDTGIYSRDEYGGAPAGDRQLDGSGDNKRKQAYRYLRRVIYEQRINCYDYPILWRELKALEDRPAMIDHPDGGSKDLADALCGCVMTLFKADYAMEPMAPQKGISLVPSSMDGSMSVEEDLLAGDVQVYNQGEIARRDAPMKYIKKMEKGPKTIAPSYKKIGMDGKATDLTRTDAEDYLIRG